MLDSTPELPTHDSFAFHTNTQHAIRDIFSVHQKQKRQDIWLAIRFSSLGLDLYNQDTHNQQQPIVILDDDSVHLMNDAAQEVGIQEGMSPATASALAEDLITVVRQAAYEKRALKQLAHVAYQFSSLVSVWHPDTLVLEVGKSLKLFSSLTEILSSISLTMHKRGYQVQLALAHTPKAAWLMSYLPEATHQHAVDWHANQLHEKQIKKIIQKAPLHYLPFPASWHEKWRRTGFTEVGDLLCLPVAALNRRFSPQLCVYLQQLTGDLSDPQQAFVPQDEFCFEQHFIDVVTTTQMLRYPVKRALHSLDDFLMSHQWHCHQLQWVFVHQDKSRSEFTVDFSYAQNDRDAFYEMTLLKLDQIRIHEPIDSMTLSVQGVAAAVCHNQSLFTAPKDDAAVTADVYQFIDKLAARLGREKVYQLSLKEQCLPENSCTPLIDVALNSDSTPRTQVSIHHQPLRPNWLLYKPQSVSNETRKKDWFAVTRPEHLQDDWQPCGDREYIVAKNKQGCYAWLFQNRVDGRWYVQGVYG